MAVTSDQFQEDFPQFTNTDSDFIDSAIATSALMLDRAVWGGLADRAQSLLVAHLLAIRDQASQTGGRSTGNLTGLSVPNEISLQYSQAAGSGSQSGLSSTVYGQEFLQLQRFKIVPIRIF
jgi:hypothetical protein